MDYKNKDEAWRALAAAERKSLGADRAAALLCGDAAIERRRVALHYAQEAARIRALLPSLPD